MILIKNGLVVDPSQGLEAVRDILIDGETIAAVDENLTADGAQVLDAAGKIVMPGLVDMHVHLREPGQEYKEDILSGTRAAAHGGVTSVASMPNTRPPVDNEAIVEMISRKAKAYGYADVYPTACITKGQKGEELTEMGLLHQSGAIAFTDDGRSVMQASMMRRALDYSKIFDGLLISHCEEEELRGAGVMNEGLVSTELGLAGIPNAVEDLLIVRDLMLSELTGARVHIAHLSTASGVQMVRAAKAKGVRVTAETTPHHLFLTDEAVRGYDTNTKVNPPLRTEADNLALIAALKDGTVDCIVTDHAPHAAEDKDCEYDYAANGISGIETSLPLVWTNLYKTGQLTLSDIVRLMSLNPAELLRIDKGTLQVGKLADVLIIDPTVEKEVKVEEFCSKGKNSPFVGMRLSGWADTVLKSGRIVVEKGEVQ